MKLRCTDINLCPGGCQKCYHSYNDGTGNKICKPYHIAGWLDVSSRFRDRREGNTVYNNGDYCRSGIIRYDDNGKYTTLPFSMFGYETFREGCIPVPDTARIILLHEYNARNNSGIWLEPGLLDLDMATRRCRIAPLHHIGDGLFGLHIFQEDWIW